MFYILAALFVVLVPVLLLMTATAAMALFNRPEGIRPPWWDWGLDKPAQITNKPALDVKIEVALVESLETKVEAADEIAKTSVEIHSRPKW